MNKPINVMIADDHLIVREGIKQILELDGDIRVIAEASNGKECIELLDEKKTDILLLDINMPEMNGLKVLQYLKEKNINVKILILTIHNEVEYLIKAADFGVDGYILKDSDSTVLKKAILTIIQGESFIQPDLRPMLKKRMSERATSLNTLEESLTKREIEVLKLLAEGLFNKEIAYTLSISEKTVKNHISNIFKKINVSDRTQAAVYAIKHNLVDIF